MLWIIVIIKLNYILSEEAINCKNTIDANICLSKTDNAKKLDCLIDKEGRKISEGRKILEGWKIPEGRKIPEGKSNS